MPLFIIFKNLGWINTYYPLVVPALLRQRRSLSFMLRQFFMGIPEELCPRRRASTAPASSDPVRIILPLCSAGPNGGGALPLPGAWNDYLGPLIYINQDSNVSAGAWHQRLRKHDQLPPAHKCSPIRT